jgi:hypothetical protein
MNRSALAIVSAGVRPDVSYLNSLHDVSVFNAPVQHYLRIDSEVRPFEWDELCRYANWIDT